MSTFCVQDGIGAFSKITKYGTIDYVSDKEFFPNYGQKSKAWQTF